MIKDIPEFASPAEGVDFLKRLEDQKDQLERDAKATQKLITKLEVDTLPELFDRFDAYDETTVAGNRATRKLLMVGSLPRVRDEDTPEEAYEHEQARKAAIELAVAYGWEPFIKCKVTSEFDRGDYEKALRVYDQLRKDNSAVVDIKEDIHFMTLQKQARERLKEGKATNLEALGLKQLPAVVLAKTRKEK
jgi:hypothetical protein